VASYYGVSNQVIANTLAGISAAFGRMEKIDLPGDKHIFLMLVKNPTGFTQTIETLTFDKKPKNILISLNDNFADGTDVSWIWDAEMEIIREIAKQIVVSGIRGEDMQLRLKYAGFDMTKVLLEKDPAKALAAGIANLEDGETLYILPTYTAMLELRRLMAAQGLVKGRLT
jgi:lipid II isoglutaminyl synthase (glutamine-hydrolysing)